MLQLVLIAALVAGATGLGGFVYGVDVGKSKERAEVSAKIEVANDAAQKVADQAAAAIAKIQVTNKTIYQKATHEIRKEPVYVDCRHVDGVFNDLNTALRGGPAQAAADSKLPRPDAADGQGVRDNNAQAVRGGGPVPPVQMRRDP